jgi:hypothetical protein
VKVSASPPSLRVRKNVHFQLIGFSLFCAITWESVRVSFDHHRSAPSNAGVKVEEEEGKRVSLVRLGPVDAPEGWNILKNAFFPPAPLSIPTQLIVFGWVVTSLI